MGNMLIQEQEALNHYLMNISTIQFCFSNRLEPSSSLNISFLI